MTIDKAIEILTRWMEVGDDEDSGMLNQAEKMGIEALKAIQATREPHSRILPSYLPGETEK